MGSWHSESSAPEIKKQNKTTKTSSDLHKITVTVKITMTEQ